MRFVTHAQFEEIITPEVVLQVVSSLQCYATAHEHMRIAQDIYYGTEDGRCPPCRRLLASIIGTGQDAVNRIKTLMQEGMSDVCLPLLVEGEDTLALPFITWKDGGKHYHYVLRGGGPLPMKGPLPMEKNHKMNEEGDFGEVFKVQINPGDRNFDPETQEHGDSNASSRANEFDLEIRSLIFAESRAQTVLGANDNGQTKRHSIQPLATFEVYDTYDPELTFYFLFPLADGNHFIPSSRIRQGGHDVYGFETDTFYNVSQTRDAVWLKKGVKDWIRRLEDHEDCVKIVYDLLKIIESDMLEVDHRKRLGSEKLVIKLEKVGTKWKRKHSLYGERHWKANVFGLDTPKEQNSGAIALVYSQDLLWKPRTRVDDQEMAHPRIWTTTPTPATQP
ncbi:uncharacterized protein PODANS_5_12030 [Podospora anserina S mat+]|uniref:Podospora anserina S mat+ genomic DNA chromosome 5, supercontig 7 n=1 Tax=Podospora anserina (strain S / ATCC MYA-4624 / DSM 980 / FGSC 10383) TaxID=515849 RepID=B2AFM5_PODAN|nr:uncharacterized protein PODANS_5_12030 [Podospora anserina S mat+]CAP62246.1 unnamed protein product [Podospora anserina S mat+]CDP29657.1 Putative protein of unknown function [Podospora anserina S mat+]